MSGHAVCGWLLLIAGAAHAATLQPDAAVVRCRQHFDPRACGEALSREPNDPELLAAEGDDLFQVGRPGEAIGVYRHALRSGAAPQMIAAKIDTAQALRRKLLGVCAAGADAAAERACEAAWLPGASDEVGVFERRGAILRAMGQPAAALAMYSSAARLAPRDRVAANGVVAASADLERLDVDGLLARGAALTLLGRPGEAVATLQRAVRLAPERVSVRARLRAAERLLAATSRPAALPPAATARRYTNVAPAMRSN